jgi:hypothetical protein
MRGNRGGTNADVLPTFPCRMEFACFNTEPHKEDIPNLKIGQIFVAGMSLLSFDD